jgi:hypothetical protein
VQDTRDELGDRVERRRDASFGDILERADEAAGRAEAAAARDTQAPDLVRRAQAGDTEARES